MVASPRFVHGTAAPPAPAPNKSSTPDNISPATNGTSNHAAARKHNSVVSALCLADADAFSHERSAVTARRIGHVNSARCDRTSDSRPAATNVVGLHDHPPTDVTSGAPTSTNPARS